LVVRPEAAVTPPATALILMKSLRVKAMSAPCSGERKSRLAATGRESAIALTMSVLGGESSVGAVFHLKRDVATLQRGLRRGRRADAEERVQRAESDDAGD